MQMEHQASSAIYAVNDLLEFEKQREMSALHLSQYITTLVEFDSVSMKFWLDFNNGLINCERSSHSNKTIPTGAITYDVPSLHHNSVLNTMESLSECLSFFGENCLSCSRTNLDKIHSIRTREEDKVDGAYISVKEWRSLRDIRHSMVLERLIHFAESFRKEVI